MPSTTCSEEMALRRLSISAILPEIMVSERAGPIFPFSMRKLFLATPEKSPLLEGAPPENRPTRMPRSMEAMIWSMEVSPGATITLKLSLPPRGSFNLLDAYRPRKKAFSFPSLMMS